MEPGEPGDRHSCAASGQLRPCLRSGAQAVVADVRWIPNESRFAVVRRQNGLRVVAANHHHPSYANRRERSACRESRERIGVERDELSLGAARGGDGETPTPAPGIDDTTRRLVDYPFDHRRNDAARSKYLSEEPTIGLRARSDDPIAEGVTGRTNSLAGLAYLDPRRLGER